MGLRKSANSETICRKATAVTVEILVLRASRGPFPKTSKLASLRSDGAALDAHHGVLMQHILAREIINHVDKGVPPAWDELSRVME